MTVKTECVVHDAAEAKRYKQMGMSDSPPKKRVGFSFHMGDVKTLTQHFLNEDDETELTELCLVNFYDGQAVPVTISYEELDSKYEKYHSKRDEQVNKIMDDN